jgi:hypothetical protein
MLKPLVMTEDGTIVLTLCFDITVYVRESFHDASSGVTNFYREAMKVIGDRAQWYYTESMGRPKKVTPKVLEMVPFWFSPAAKQRSVYQMTLRAGTTENEIQPTRFQLFASDTKRGEKPSTDPSSDTGILRLTLPPDAAEEAGEMIDLTKRLLASLPYVSGHAGYGLVWDETEMDNDVLARIRTWARRYQGLDVFGFLSVENIVVTGIKAVNWLTIVNNANVAKLGGRRALKEKLGSQVVLHEVPGGLVIQAGASPQLGDVNRNETLPLYRRVGRLLAPVRERPDPDEIYPFVGDEETTIEWLSRFDR